MTPSGFEEILRSEGWIQIETSANSGEKWFRKGREVVMIENSHGTYPRCAMIFPPKNINKETVRIIDLEEE